jgi:hypothetical protein
LPPHFARNRFGSCRARDHRHDRRLRRESADRILKQRQSALAREGLRRLHAVCQPLPLAASPTRRSAPVAFGVKIATYSSGDARKKSSTVARARSTNAVIAAEVGLSECGLPKTFCRKSWRCSASCESA